ncbi:MAG TPA: hypothetical protein VFC05_06060 [Nitrososphaeraceae archaeon]|nr:hypothetical protein [Nitrososphaeraceae archaeon]
MYYKLFTILLISFFIILISITFSNSYSQDSDCIYNETDWDGDGIPNVWETRGIDINNDKVIDYGLSSFNVSPLHKDLFLEIDYMKHHDIFAGVLERIQQAFKDSGVCNPGEEPDGINLHIQYDQEIPHQHFIPTFSFVGSDYLRTWKGFDDLKNKYFGTKEEKDDNPNVNNTLLAKSKIFHYVIFAHSIDSIDNTMSGLSRGIPAMDFIVSLGNWKSGGANVIGHYNGNANHQAGTIMHEFGHNLGLGHGGGDGINCKPNYLSIMNYLRQMPVKLPPAFYKLDYSRIELNPLNESSLDETKGVNPRVPIDIPDVLIIGNNFNFVKYPIDWNYNGRFESRITQDINLYPSIGDCAKNTPRQFLNGYDDWDNLIFITNQSKFGTYGSGILEIFSTENGTLKGTDELTYDDVKGMIETTLESVNNTTSTYAPNRTLGEELNSEVMSMIETKLESVNNTTSTVAPESIPVKDFYTESILGDSLSKEADDNLLLNTSSVISENLSPITTENNLISLFDEPFNEELVSSLNSSSFVEKVKSNTYDIDYNKTINNLESLKTTFDSSLGGLKEDDLITDPIAQRNAYSEIDSAIDILKANSCLEDNCIVLEKHPNKTLIFSSD